MPEGISIFDVIKRGGFEASLITTFNATLPFYEEVVLRKLVSAGCRHNVVLMDRTQCSVAWESEATRPRLAGYAYSLLPVSVPGAFHPKVCLLLGPKKASLLIGSHNLTLSGFGYNREITNLIEIAGSKDADGAGILKSVWLMVRRWIELERNTVPEPLLESALAIANFVSPLILNAGPIISVVPIAQTPGDEPLLDQVAKTVSEPVRRIGVIGAFFDQDQTFIKELQSRWPTAEIVVGIDPETVHMPGKPDFMNTKFVDARQLWSKDAYLHAKLLYLKTDTVATDVFVSGSANPSRPAWMASSRSGNVEAVLLRRGEAARAAAEMTGIHGLFNLLPILPEVFASIAQRTAASNDSDDQASIPLWTGVADHDLGVLRITCRGDTAKIFSVTLLGSNMERLEEIEKIEVSGNEILICPSIDLAGIRSCLLADNDRWISRVMILHPNILSSSSRSSKQYQIRSALSALGSSDGDISKVISSVERVIFADETTREIDLAVREHRERRDGGSPASGPESLVISAGDLPKTKKKLRLLKSGDLAYLIDVLLRRMSEGLETQIVETDKSGRTEEEQVGQDDAPVDFETADSESPPATTLTDSEIAILVARRARALCRKMVHQLEAAAKDENRRAGAVIQLIAVLALVRELRHLDKTKRWRATGHLLIDECDRRSLLDESIKYLLGSTCHFIDFADKVVGESTDESTQLRVLLLWLAWDLGKELTEQIAHIWDAKELHDKLAANALFLKLMPDVAIDQLALDALKESIEKTVKATPECAGRAALWLNRHQSFGVLCAQGLNDSEELRLGGYCRIPGIITEPHVVVELNDRVVGFWVFDRVRRFERTIAVALTTL